MKFTPGPWEYDNERLVFQINKLSGFATESYTLLENGKYQDNLGNYHLDYAYGGVKLVQLVNQGGGIRTISGGGYGTKKELYHFLDGMLQGLTNTQKRD